MGVPGRAARASAPRPEPGGIGAVLRVLRRKYDFHRFVRENREDPYRILVSCLLSLRTRDETTYPATQRLFDLATTPGKMAALPARRIERAIYPVGFYRTKARTIRRISRELLARHSGHVPRSLPELLALPGVGRKTANLVLGKGYGIPAICVDTHVHRISNRLAWVATSKPEETESALGKVLPRRAWIDINELLVRHGQIVCHPVSPACSRCPVSRHCPRRGVLRSR